jgi:hypothetical protein
VLPPPPVPEIVHLVPGESASIQSRHTPQQIEVWRPESSSPQKPVRRGRRFELAYVIGTQPVVMRLQFDPQAAGKAVVVLPGPGVTIDRSETGFFIGSNGQLIVSVRLDGSFRRSDLTLYCVGVKTKLALSRAPQEVVEAEEAKTRGRP